MARTSSARRPARTQAARVERLAHTAADWVRAAPVPSAAFRGVVRHSHASIERWGAGPIEVWCIRTGFDRKHRQLFRAQWLRFQLSQWIRALDSGRAPPREIEQRALEILRPWLEGPVSNTEA